MRKQDKTWLHTNSLQTFSCCCLPPACCPYSHLTVITNSALSYCWARLKEKQKKKTTKQTKQNQTNKKSPQPRPHLLVCFSSFLHQTPAGAHHHSFQVQTCRCNSSRALLIANNFFLQASKLSLQLTSGEWYLSLFLALNIHPETHAYTYTSSISLTSAGPGTTPFFQTWIL